MRRNRNKFLKYLRSHLTETIIAAVAATMMLTIVLRVSGKDFTFNPGNIDTSYRTEFSDASDGTGYDLTEDGKDSREADRSSELEEDSLDLTKTDAREDRNDSVILPDGMTGGIRPSGTVDASVNSSGTLSGGNPSAENPSGTYSPGDGNKPGSGERPGGGDSPGNSGPGEEHKISVIIGGQELKFDSEDEALAWVADNMGKNDAGQYFEGFIKDENGNLIPSYTDQDKFNGDPGGDVAYDYVGDSGIFIVPEGKSVLDFAFSSSLSGEKVKTIVIPKTVTKIIAGEGNPFSVLEKFIVSENNPFYISVDGVLYLKTGAGKTELVMMPAKKTEVKKWPSGLISVGEYSFYKSGLAKVEFPDTVLELKDNAFAESSVGTVILPESIKSIGNYAFMFENMKEAHKIIVKSPVPPAVGKFTFSFMTQAGSPTAEIIVPDSIGDEIYEAYLMNWGAVMLNQYKGDAVLKILKTQNGAQTRYEYYEENGYKGYRRKNSGEPLFFQDSLGVYTADENGGKVLVKCLSASTQVDLSKTGITAVREGAFDGCSSLECIILPESLTVLPENVFINNKRLKVVIFYAPSVTAVNPGMPDGCGVFVRPEALAGYQDAWGAQVRRIMGTSQDYFVTSAGLVLDTGSTRLIDIPENMETLTLPGSITSIMPEAAAGHKNLIRVTIPGTVRDIGAGAFTGCTKLNLVSWNTAASVPDSCFEGCANLTAFNAGNAGHNLTEIGNRAFYGCQSLGTVLWYSYSSNGTSYYYYYYLKSIGAEAFYGCTSMTYAYLHTSVGSVGARAFAGSGLAAADWYTAAAVPEGCFNNRGAALLTLNFTSSVPPAWDQIDSIEGLVIYVPDSDGDAVYRLYLDAWKEWLGEHPENVLKTKNGAENKVFISSAEPETVLEEEESSNDH